MTIYFDNSATTPVDPRVTERMVPWFTENFGNPSSLHALGRQAREAVEHARGQIATLLGARPREILFTASGSEANNLALLGTIAAGGPGPHHLVTDAIEHPAILETVHALEKQGVEVTILPVDRVGRVAPEDVAQSLRPHTRLVSIMAANNEIGTIQPVAALGQICQQNGIIFHTDAVQWFGKEPFETIGQFQADLVSICGHKFHGPKGAGLLYIKSPLHPDPILFGGGHENERRAGTENLAGIAGLVLAMEKFIKPPVFSAETIKPLVQLLTRCLKNIEGCHLVSPDSGGLANTVAFVVDRADSIALLAGLDMEGICASSGSACSAGSVEPSHVVTALGQKTAANSLIRFSLGRNTTAEEVDLVCASLPGLIRRAQRANSMVTACE